jgi:radical SAM superfamily enzyme YgiQ (UPF0313 family)
MSTPFILLINPWIYDFSAYDLWIKPLGLLSIAKTLKKNGFGIHLLDCLDTNNPHIKENCRIKIPSKKETGKGNFLKEEISKPDVLKGINRKYSRYGVFPSFFQNEINSIPKPDAVLITSFMTYWYPGVFEAIKIVRSAFSDVPILLGGIYATLCREHARLFSKANNIFTGPFDINALLKIESLTGKSIDNLNYNIFPSPDYNLMSSKKFLPILTSIGCIFKCSYCASSLLYPYFIQRNPLEVVDEIEFWIGKEGTTDFVFYDDSLLSNALNHFVPMLQEIIKRNISVRFHVPNGLHIRNIDSKIAELMMKTGFKTVRLGLESADPHLQKETGNKVTRVEFTRAAMALKNAGFTSSEVGVYVLAGLPKQEFQSAYDTVRFVQDYGLRAYIAEYSPIPGTDMWKKAVECSAFPISNEPLFHNKSILPCRWEGFTLDDLDFLKRESRKNN